MKGVVFGTSSARETQAEYLHDFFKAVDRGIHPILAQDRQPLILAGVMRELAIYRKVNPYSPVLAGAVHGSPDSLRAEALYAKGSALMAAYSARAKDTALSDIEDASNRGLLATDPAAVIEAARTGMVEELIVAPGTPASDRHEETVNWAALATIRNSGRIGVLNGSQLTHGVAAVLRFREETEPWRPSAAESVTN
jgi:hypothetical protein